MSLSSAGVWTCANRDCSVKSDKSKLSWVVCGICEKTYDIKCQGIDTKCFQALSTRSDFFWLCKNCMSENVISEGKIEVDFSSNPTQVIDSVKNIDEKVEALLKKNAMVVDEIKTLQVKMNSIQPSVSKKLEEVENKIDTHQTKWSDLFSSMDSKSVVTVDHVKRAISEVTELDKEMEVRSKGIVIYNAPEVNEVINHKSKDVDFVRSFLKQVGCDELNVTEINRLGRFSQEKIENKKYRPIKVRFDSNHSRELVLKSLFKLKDAEGALSKLSIRQDLSVSQRQELSLKHKEAYEKTIKSDFVYRVKGTPGNYSIQQVKKKGSD